MADPYPVLVIIIVGLIGAMAIFIFGLFKIPGPAAVFFILSFVMTTGMAIDSSAIDEMPQICKEINNLQEALSI